MNKSITLDELQAAVAEEIKKPGVDYSPTNCLLNVHYHTGNMARFGRKKRTAAKGIGKDDPVVGKEKVAVQVGKALFNIAAFCEHNDLTLQECRDAACAEVAEKHGA